MFEIGTTLRQARERRGVSLEVAAEATKIRAGYLGALEDERFEALPGPTYARGFLRAYATYLDLDPQPFVDEYAIRFTVPPWELDEDVIFPRRRPGRNVNRSRTETGVIVIALAVIVAVGLLVIAAASSPDPSTPARIVITETVTDGAFDDLDPVNPIATAVTAVPAEPTTPVSEPIPLTIEVREQVTITVRALGLDETVPPLFQQEVDPAADGTPTRIEIPLSPSGYLIRLDRPGTVSLLLEDRVIAPGPADREIVVDTDGTVTTTA
jgi:cytoskeletal protein RodZ